MSWKEHRSEIWAEVWLESRPFQWGVICIAGACCALRVLQAGNLSALCSFVLDFTLASGLMFCVMQQWMSHKIQNIAKVSAMEMIGQRSWDEALAGGKEDHREGPQTDKLQEPDQEDEEDEYEDEPQLQAGSPADLILEVLDLIIAGGMPHSHDLHLLRDSILRGALHKAMYQPLDLGQDLHRLIMEPDVEASLYQQLLGCTMTPRDAGEPAQECLQPGIKQGPPSMRTISGKLTAASSLEGELEEEPVGSEGFLAKILTSLASDTGGILKARHLPPGRSKSSTFLSKLMVLQKGRRLSYRDELKPSKRVSETIMGDPSLMVLEDGPSTGRSSPTTGACLKPAPASKMLKDPPTSPPQGTLDLLLSKVRPSGQNCSSSSRRSSWHVMNMNAAELDSSLPYDDTAAEDRRASTASVRSSGGEEKGGVQGSKSKRRWSVGWQLQEQLQEQQEQPMQQLLHGHDSLAHPLREEMDHVLGLAYDNFSFDAFKLAAVTQGHPLSTLAFYLFHKNNLITGFNLHAVKLARFLRNIEAGYCPKNPYHSAIHAADVLQTLHVVMQQGGIVPQYADRLSLMAALMAAIMHDYEHMGLTNDFLVNTSSTLAIRYNDHAPLENHHLAASFSLLCAPDQDFLGKLSKAEFTRLRKVGPVRKEGSRAGGLCCPD
uniref:Phosphodiesterase n=2 Tax=Dunaliella tertiolecta TaxID=3047 RepID=A0A7S3VT42_DUNTE